MAPTQKYSGPRLAYRNRLSFDELERATDISAEEIHCFLCSPERLNNLSAEDQEVLRKALLDVIEKIKSALLNF